jgi:hypothetical protein
VGKFFFVLVPRSLESKKNTLSIGLQWLWGKGEKYWEAEQFDLGGERSFFPHSLSSLRSYFNLLPCC